MTTKFMIDEIEGILILLGKQANEAMLKAFEKLPEEEVKAYRDSLVQEYHVIHPEHTLLVV